jgi:hypothetical protein
MESRSVYRNNQIIYPDLYYIWTYIPSDISKKFFKKNKQMYTKHICGVGFYSRFHARHIVSLIIGKKALLYIHIIRGDKLIKDGIRSLPAYKVDRIYVNNPFTPDGSKKIRRWIYPPEFRMDKHRRRHFILYLVKSAEDKGVRAFDNKYKKYFNGYKESITVGAYLRKRKKILRSFIQELREANGLPKEGIRYDSELLSAYHKQVRAANRKKKRETEKKLLG